MIRFVSVFLFIVIFVAGSFSRDLQASNLLNHVAEKHVSQHDYSDDHHHGEHEKGDKNEEKKHDHILEISLLVQPVNVENRMEVVQVLSLLEIWTFPLFVIKIHLSNYTSSLFRPPIA